MFYIRISSKSPKGKTWFPFPWQHEIECYLRGDWDYIACGFCGSPSAQERYGTGNAVVVTGLAVRCTQSWMRSIARCVIKLKLNCRHWDQPLHSYPPIICIAMTKKQPVFKCHHSPSQPTLWKSARIPFETCKCCWHNALDLMGVLIWTFFVNG